jgi:membrane associated rhomboid family serine protease
MTADEVWLRQTRRRALADEWALVLASAGIEARIRPTGHGFGLEVASEDASRAATVLETWQAENPPPPRVRPWPLWTGDVSAGLLVPLLLAGFFWWTGPRNPAVAWFAAGSADAARILAGEWWRTVTALTLHADAAHAAGNALTGALFLTAACRLLGPGAALSLALAAGAGGNAVNAWVHGDGHVSVGASTAVFGAVGLLGGAGVVRRRRLGTTGRHAWVPVAASVGLLAMLGASGDDVDIWAHLFGLASGAVLGLAAAATSPGPAPAAVQWLFGLGGAGLVLYCWRLALDAISV